MAKRISNRAKRRNIERGLKKGKGFNSLSKEELIYHLKYTLNRVQSNIFINNFDDSKLEFIYANPLPENYNEIRKIGLTYANDEFDKELIWYERIIKKHNYEINLFLELEQKFEKHFLLGEYAKAMEIIDFVEKTICVSYWSIEKKILITENEFGFKKNKEILTEIVSEDNDFLTNLLARHQSIRVEKNLSHFKYEEIFRSYANQYHNKELIEYLNYKLNFFSAVDFHYKGFLLYMENNSSIIDRYLIFRNTILLTVCNTKNESKGLNQLKSSCINIVESINDTCLKNVLNSEGELSEMNLTDENIKFLKCLDYYTVGDYENCFIETKKFLKNNPTYFELYNIYIKTLINLNYKLDLENPFLEELQLQAKP